MKHIQTARHAEFFNPLMESKRLQAAMMTLAAGESSSDEMANEHPRAEQWLFVVRGRGRVRVSGRSAALGAGSLVWIEAGEPHQITNTGRSPLVTINFYAPPAYTASGNVRRRART